MNTLLVGKAESQIVFDGRTFVLILALFSTEELNMMMESFRACLAAMFWSLVLLIFIVFVSGLAAARKKTCNVSCSSVMWLERFDSFQGALLFAQGVADGIQTIGMSMQQEQQDLEPWILFSNWWVSTGWFCFRFKLRFAPNFCCVVVLVWTLPALVAGKLLHLCWGHGAFWVSLENHVVTLHGCDWRERLVIVLFHLGTAGKFLPFLIYCVAGQKVGALLNSRSSWAPGAITVL